ncbi:MAG: hypothetical protein HYZ53_25585 [Planctomycetes bacterium]|nr:hypothetical protein [Planctomycetota bacterium]
MGLQEERAKKEALEKWLPARQKEVNEVCGGNIPLEVDWATFATDAKGISWLENNGPVIVARGFRRICKDDLGKEAIRNAVKKILFKNITDPKAKKMSLEGGVFECCFAFAQSPGGRYDEHEVAKFLEGRL